MHTVMIACRTLQDELNLAVQETGCRHPIIWVDSEYHLDPNVLRQKLQQEIDAQQNTDTILFAYGSCGNGLSGLTASTAALIIPKTDDCISLVLSRPGEKFDRPKQTYFITKGWLESSKSFMKEYHHAINRYGEQRAKKIFEQIFKHYRYLMMIDTTAYPLVEWTDKAHELAKNINLELVMAKGGIRWLKKLLTGPYDDSFCVIPKGGTVKTSDFGYINEMSANQVISLY